MRTMEFGTAIDDALGQAMGLDERVMLLGEDVPGLHRELFARFGPGRVRVTPISESAFLGAAVTAAMSGLRPVVEIMLVDFAGVCADALLNHAAKTEAFSGGQWQVPLVVRSACGGGYGDGGQHEQSLWGWFAHIPGLAVVVPSIPADAGGLFLGALAHGSPVVYLEHKLLSARWLDVMGRGGRRAVHFDVPTEGSRGPVPDHWEALPLGHAAVRREGQDITLISIGVGVHRALSAALGLEEDGVSAGVIDLRTIAPLDTGTICAAVGRTGRVIVVDEDYEGFGLSGEIAAVLLEAGIAPKYARVCTASTIPYARHLEDQVLPGVDRILEAARGLLA